MTWIKESAFRAASEAAFGSCARGDDDKLSDRDILIVDDDVSILRARAAMLKAQGLSVASYTFSKLDRLAACGALFLQHLRLESVIAVDQDDRLGSLLASFRPKEKYDEELRQNALLAELVSSVSVGRVSELWSADVLYVTVRNFGVLWLAGRGEYIFAFERILEALRDADMVSDCGLSSLRQLRFLKALYRSDYKASVGVVRSKVVAALNRPGFSGGRFV
ncbi:hypothetical protein [Mesorhizobium sp. M1329]|uniref:hypothetical protein n=1 Tax=Mesorhizobium sp. M1329 TaxID=2957083 RepID=UPI0033370698